MDVYDLILAVVGNEPEGRLVGRTLLHKKLFFLNELISGPLHFSPHYYGPYSREVASAVDSLVSSGLLKERAESVPFFNTPWGDSTRYIYALPDDVKASWKPIVRERLGKQYNTIVQTIKRINSQPESENYRFLSIAAKVMQILKGKGRMSVADFPKEAEKLGWRISNQDLDGAIKFLQHLKLLRLKP